MKQLFLFCTLLGFVFSACNQTEIGDSDDIAPAAIAQQINVVLSDDNELIAEMKLRVSGVNGTTLVLNEPAYVKLDGVKLNVDSSKSEGAFYRKKLTTIPSTHTFVYSDKDGKKYTNKFQFAGFGLAKPIPSVISRSQNLELSIKGLPANSKVNCIITDTANHITDEDYVLKNNVLIVEKTAFQKLKSGAIWVELYYKHSITTNEHTKEGGEINYNYELKKIKAKLQ